MNYLVLTIALKYLSRRENMNPYPLVSIVTPSFNSGRFIAETIESVRNQDYPSIEHIVIDGGSNDGTVEILKRFPQLHWVSEPDSGQSEALNKGFRFAKGEIIGWLNADDTYQPSTVSTAIHFLQENPSIDCVYSDVQVIDDTGQLIGVSRSQPFDLWTLVQTNFMKQPTVFMRRRIIEKLKGVDESLHYVMDQELWLRVGLAGFKMHYLRGQALANFRICLGTKSYEQTPRFQSEWLQVLERAFNDQYFDNIDGPAKLKVLKKYKGRYYFSESIHAIRKKNRREMLFYFAKAINEDIKLIFNRGCWLIIGMGLMGRSVDWRRKFKRD